MQSSPSAAPSPDTLVFYIPAKGFLQAAQMVESSPFQNDSRRAMTFLPINTLLGFSVELYLKTWLVACGRTPEQVRKKFGHDLQALYDACMVTQMPAPSGVAALVSELKLGHSDYSFRYFRPERHIYQGANTARAFAVLNELDELIDRKIGASASHGLSPGH